MTRSHDIHDMFKKHLRYYALDEQDAGGLKECARRRGFDAPCLVLDMITRMYV